MILATTEVITVTLKMISATRKLILATKDMTTASWSKLPFWHGHQIFFVIYRCIPFRKIHRQLVPWDGTETLSGSRTTRNYPWLLRRVRVSGSKLISYNYFASGLDNYDDFLLNNWSFSLLKRGSHYCVSDSVYPCMKNVAHTLVCLVRNA